MAQARWYKFLKWCEYWEALSQESLLKHKESRTNPQDSMPPQSKAKVETKSFQKLKDSEDKIFLEAQGKNLERWKATRKRKACRGREPRWDRQPATKLRSYLLRNDVSLFPLSPSLPCTLMSLRARILESHLQVLKGGVCVKTPTSFEYLISGISAHICAMTKLSSEKDAVILWRGK